MNKTRNFTHRNENFVCDYCGKEVLPLARGCRNHCPHCLRSKHVDTSPGDRANSCQGTMHPVGYSQSGREGLVLEFECESCGFRGRNKAAHEDPVQPDDYDKILALSDHHR